MNQLGREVAHVQASASISNEGPDGGEFVLQRTSTGLTSPLLDFIYHCRQEGSPVRSYFLSLVLDPSDIDIGTDVAHFYTAIHISLQRYEKEGYKQ